MTGLDRADMTQAAFLGLRQAAETFDPTKGAAFGTHAYWWMKAMCHEESYRMRSTIRVPKKPRSPIPKCGSFDVDDGEGANIPGADDTDPTTALDRAELHAALATALDRLPQRDRLAVELRFGINGAERPHTLNEIGDHLGVSGTRASDILSRGLDHLRDVLAEFA